MLRGARIIVRPGSHKLVDDPVKQLIKKYR
jgi:hypothetical protein